MRERSQKVSKLLNDPEFRASYLRAKLNVNVPSQIRALRRRRSLTQGDLAAKAGMKQPSISKIETPGATNFNLETLVRLAVAFEVALIVKFAPFSEVVKWENGFSQDTFSVAPIDRDLSFLQPLGCVTAFLAEKDGPRLRKPTEPDVESSAVVTDIGDFRPEKSLMSAAEAVDMNRETGNRSNAGPLSRFLEATSGNSQGYNRKSSAAL